MKWVGSAYLIRDHQFSMYAMGGGVGIQPLLTFAYDRGGRGPGIAYIRNPPYPQILNVLKTNNTLQSIHFLLTHIAEEKFNYQKS